MALTIVCYFIYFTISVIGRKIEPVIERRQRTSENMYNTLLAPVVFTRHWRWNVESKNKNFAKITNGKSKKSQY